MKIYQVPSRFMILPGREGEFRFGSVTVRVLGDTQRTPKEYLVAIEDEILLDTSGTPAIFLDYLEAADWGKEQARHLSLGRKPPVPEAPPPPPPPRADRPRRRRRRLGRSR